MAAVNVDYMDLGLRLRMYRRREGLTLQQLAPQVGVTPSFLAQAERGEKALSLETLVALCRALRVGPEQLLTQSLKRPLTPEEQKRDEELRIAFEQLALLLI